MSAAALNVTLPPLLVDPHPTPSSFPVPQTHKGRRLPIILFLLLLLSASPQQPIISYARAPASRTTNENYQRSSTAIITSTSSPCDAGGFNPTPSAGCRPKENILEGHTSRELVSSTSNIVQTNGSYVVQNIPSSGVLSPATSIEHQTTDTLQTIDELVPSHSRDKSCNQVTLSTDSVISDSPNVSTAAPSIYKITTATPSRSPSDLSISNVSRVPASSSTATQSATALSSVTVASIGSRRDRALEATSVEQPTVLESIIDSPKNRISNCGFGFRWVRGLCRRIFGRRVTAPTSATS